MENAFISYLDLQKHRNEHRRQSTQSSLVHITCPAVRVLSTISSTDMVAVHELDVSGNGRNQYVGLVKQLTCSSSESNKRFVNILWEARAPSRTRSYATVGKPCLKMLFQEMLRNTNSAVIEECKSDKCSWASCCLTLSYRCLGRALR